ncbi:MAG: M20/M25/M40 family metallo-hydrolase [Eubacteriales bacterium]
MKINKTRLISSFTDMVSIDSPTLSEDGMALYIKSRLSDLGVTLREDDAGVKLGGSSGNLHGLFEGEADMEPVLFCCHMDTVEPSSGKRAVISEDGKITSAGDTVLGADDCSGIAAIIEALTTIKENGLKHRPIELLFTIAEETLCSGIKQFDCSALHSRQAYVLDLSGHIGTAAYAAPTILTFTAKIRGRAAHAGFAPQEGIHAVKVAADAISRLKMGRNEGESTVNIGVISGGRATNIVPDYCEVRGEVRSFSHDRALELTQSVAQVFEESASSLGASVSFERDFGCIAYETSLEHPVTQRFKQACGRLGLPVSLIRTFGGSDCSVLAGHGIAGLVVSCGMEKCHSLEEYTTADMLSEAAELVLSLMTEL